MQLCKHDSERLDIAEEQTTIRKQCSLSCKFLIVNRRQKQYFMVNIDAIFNEHLFDEKFNIRMILCASIVYFAPRYQRR